MATEAQITLVELFRVLARGRWALLVITFASALASAGYALSRKPLFESSALLAPVPDPSAQLGSVGSLLGRFGGLSDVLGIGGGTGTSAEEAVALMESRDFTIGYLRRNQILPVLYSERWDTEHQRWRVESRSSSGPFDWLTGGSDARPAIGSDTGDAASVPGEPGAERAIERFATMREIVIDRRTGFVHISVRAPSPAMAKAWLEALIRDGNATLRDKALAEVRSSLALLTGRMESLQYETVRSTAASLLESYMRREVVLLSRTDYALSAIDPPNLPEQRVYPRRTRMVAIGASVGLLLGCVVIILLNARRGVRTTPTA